LDWFSDRDGDDVYDLLDKCPNDPGIESAGGCPPELRSTPNFGYDDAPGGIRIKRLIVNRVPKGAKLVAKCPGCRTESLTARRTGTVAFSGIVGRVVRAGATIELRVTLGRSTGKYRFGAIGKRFRWPVRAGAVGTRSERCLNPRSGKPQRCP
jgi:hypothetical protein